MPHEISRVLHAVAARPWAIDPAKGEEIAALLELRAGGKTGIDFKAEDRPEASRRAGAIAVIPLMGSIMPRGDMLSAMSGATSLTAFQARFKEAANDPRISAIILEVDSPGGSVDLVPETAALIRSARRAGRPIVAVANTMAASAAYWIASAADELVATPSGLVGSVGVYMMHVDRSEQLAMDGLKVSFVKAGERKVEGNPYEPLGDVARAALQAEVSELYDQFTRDVAKARGVPQARVKADPEKAEKHFGGGRGVSAREALRLGMIDRIETLDQTVARLRGKGRRAA